MKADFFNSEIRALFDIGRRYAAGTSSVQELNGAVSRAQTWAKASGASAVILELLEEWMRMVNRRWNEWGLEKRPLSEEEFLAWLREQLVGFES